MCQEKIKGLLEGKDWVLAKEILDLSGINKQSFYNNIRKMVLSNEIIVDFAHKVILDKNRLQNVRKDTLAYRLIENET